MNSALILAVLATDRYLNKETRYQYSYIVEMMEAECMTVSKNDLDSMVESGLLKLNPPKGEEEAHIDHYIITDNALKSIFGESTHWGEELYDAYPDYFVANNGEEYPLKLADLDELFSRYHKAVKVHSMHRHVMDLVKWAKEKREISMGIDKFVYSQYWRVLQKKKNEQATASWKSRTI